jgi:hypothetical protein
MATTTILRRPAPPATPRRTDEELINRSLLDSLDAQADAEPLSSSDSEPAPGTLSPSSSMGSPSMPSQISSIHSQLYRNTSPGPHHHHIGSPNSIDSFTHTHMYNNSSFHMDDNITPRAHEKFGQKQPGTFGGVRGRFSLANALREGTREYGSYSDVLPSGRQGITRQSFDALSQYEYNASAALPNNAAAHSKVSFSNVDPFGAAAGQQQPQVSAHRGSISIGPRQQLGGFHATQAQAQAGAVHSQTPFGPHVAAAPAMQSALSATATLVNGPVQPTSQEEISTIFVVGFPDDMQVSLRPLIFAAMRLNLIFSQEREFQNMFTFSPGFEAATLKIPNKESTAYGANANRSAYPYNGANDPYNLVTVNQGGVIVDNGRDGLATTWAAGQHDDSQFGANPNQAPRKQIIGFAKFRTRQEAIDARDILQGRRVDAEKGAVLKAEMAKKNLHTKRGVGQPGLSIPGSMLPGEVSMPATSALPSLSAMVSSPSSGSEGTREFNAVNLGVLGQRRDQISHMSDRDHTMTGLGIQGVASRDLREQMDEEDYAPRRRQQQEVRQRGPDAAFEAFHSIPIHMARNTAVNSLTNELAEPAAVASEGLSSYAWGGIGNGAIRKVPSTLSAVSAASLSRSHHSAMDSDHNVSPTRADAGFDSAPPSASSQDGFDSDEPLGVERVQRALPQELIARPSSADSSHSGSSQVAQPDGVGMSLAALHLSDPMDETSPDLPSPSSNTSSSHGMPKVNGADQNPPINTLYVGNLPTAPTLVYPNQLEDALKALFERCPGYRQLCFRQKSNGPMCFVEVSRRSIYLWWSDCADKTCAVRRRAVRVQGAQRLLRSHP